MSAIRNIFAREIVDSRGTPTVEVEVFLEKLSSLASVPSGASTGTYEAHELRDEDKNRFFGKGVTKAVDLINSEINETIQGMKITDQSLIDKTLINLDGTHNKSRLGANSILAVSLACAKAAAKFLNLPLFSYIGGISTSLPTPLMNIVNGGCHSNNKLDFQEFMIIPLGFSSFKDALRAGCEVFHCLKNLLNKNSFSISVGDEGGFAPDFSSNKQCLDFIIDAIEKSGYKPGQEIYIGLDVASSEFFDGNKYKLASESLELSSQDIVRYYQNLIENYPIIYPSLMFLCDHLKKSYPCVDLNSRSLKS